MGVVGGQGGVGSAENVLSGDGSREAGFPTEEPQGQHKTRLLILEQRLLSLSHPHGDPGDPSYLLPSHWLQNTKAPRGRSLLCFWRWHFHLSLEALGMVGMVALLSLGCESLGSRGVARKGMGVGDKRPIGVTGYTLATWNVGEREAHQEALSSLSHTQEGTSRLA